MLKSEALKVGVELIKNQIQGVVLNIDEDGERASFTYKNKDGVERSGKLWAGRANWDSPHNTLSISFDYHRGRHSNDNFYIIRRKTTNTLAKLPNDKKTIERLSEILELVEHSYSRKKQEEQVRDTERGFAKSTKPLLIDAGYNVTMSSGSCYHGESKKLTSNVCIDKTKVRFSVNTDNIELIKRLKAVCDEYES